MGERLALIVDLVSVGHCVSEVSCGLRSSRVEGRSVSVVLAGRFGV